LGASGGKSSFTTSWKLKRSLSPIVIHLFTAAIKDGIQENTSRLQEQSAFEPMYTIDLTRYLNLGSIDETWGTLDGHKSQRWWIPFNGMWINRLSGSNNFATRR
jgi:hypothetical protein